MTVRIITSVVGFGRSTRLPRTRLLEPVGDEGSLLLRLLMVFSKPFSLLIEARRTLSRIPEPKARPSVGGGMTSLPFWLRPRRSSQVDMVDLFGLKSFEVLMVCYESN